MHSGSEGVAVAPVTASAAMGSARARAGREAEEGTGSRGREGRCRGEGECVAPSGASSGERVSRRWPERARARRAHALLPTGRRLKTVEAAVGWVAGIGPGGLRGKFFCSILYFLFCFL